MITDKSLLTIPKLHFALNKIVPMLECTKLPSGLRLISFEISRNAKAKPLGQSLDDMLVYAKDYMILRLMIEF